MPGTLGQVFPVLSPEDAELSINMVRPACRESISALSAQRAGWLVLDGSRMPAKGYGVFFRELSRGAPGRNATALPLGYLLADGKAHSRSFVLGPLASRPICGISAHCR